MGQTLHTLRTAGTVARLEWQLEWRQGHQLAAVGLFAIASVYVAFQASDQHTGAAAWTAMLWLVHLFSGFTAIGRLFDRERPTCGDTCSGLRSRSGSCWAKLFHAVLTTTASRPWYSGHFLLFWGGLKASKARKAGLLVLGAWLGGLSMTTTLVFVSAVASQVRNGSGALAAVLGLPLAIAPTHPRHPPHARCFVRRTLDHAGGIPRLFGGIGRWNSHHRMYSLPLHLAGMKGSWNWFWKGGSVLLLAYVIVRGFCTPLQPGLVSATPSQLSGSAPIVTS